MDFQDFKIQKDKIKYLFKWRLFMQKKFLMKKHYIIDEKNQTQLKQILEKSNI